MMFEHGIFSQMFKTLFMFTSLDCLWPTAIKKTAWKRFLMFLLGFRQSKRGLRLFFPSKCIQFPGCFKVASGELISVPAAH
jgi:hypothetical protein